MTYSYRTRLKMGGDRLGEVNLTRVNYMRYGGNTIPYVLASMVLRNPMSVNPNAAITRTDRQQFVIDTDQLQDGANNYFVPILGDIIEVDATKEQFEVIPEDDDSPIYQYITSDRSNEGGRLMIFSQRITED